MTERQLTVAELLAQAQRDNPDAPRRPRRRRSLEEGGVSVAELTDSIKKVDAKPAEVKHSAVPIDAPAEPEHPAEHTPTEPERPVERTGSTSRRITLPPREEAAPEAPAQVAPSADETTVLQKAEPVESAEPAEPAEPVEVAEVAETVEVVEPADTAEDAPEVAAEPAPAEPASADEFRVEEFPAQRPPADPTTQETPVVADAPEPARETEQLEEATPVVTPAELDTPSEEIRAIEVEEASVNPILMVLVVFMGVLLGVLGFLAFKWLWANTAVVVAALLALATVLAVVFGVRAMRTGRDGLTMALAGLAAAVMAFGPYFT